MLTKLKIDFCNDEICAICESHRKLKEAVFLKDENHQIVTVSKHCYIKYKHKISVANYNAIVPDLTKGKINSSDKSNNNTRENVKSNETENGLYKKNRLIEYLILRQEKLVDFGTAYNKLDNLYENYMKYGFLNNEQYRYLDNLIKYTESNKAEYSHTKLQKLYASSFWLKHAIEKTENLERKSFLSGILRYYQEKGYITIKQNNHVLETFERINLKIKSNKIPTVEFIIK